MKPGVLLCSGGIDSVTLAYLLKRHNALQCLFFCDYGQASADHQFGLVQEHADILGVEAIRETFDWPEYAKGRGFIFEKGKYPAPMTDPYAPLKMNAEEYSTYLEDQWDFIQGRNIAFLTKACAFVLSILTVEAVVYVAFQFDKPEWDAEPGGCDTSPQFVEAFNRLAAAGGFSKKVTVEAPFLDSRLTKQQIVGMARLFSVELDKTYSCEFFPACGKCRQCLVRKMVFAQPVRFR